MFGCAITMNGMLYVGMANGETNGKFKPSFLCKIFLVLGRRGVGRYTKVRVNYISSFLCEVGELFSVRLKWVL